jgi:hypothetical protein
MFFEFQSVNIHILIHKVVSGMVNWELTFSLFLCFIRKIMLLVLSCCVCMLTSAHAYAHTLTFKYQLFNFHWSQYKHHANRVHIVFIHSDSLPVTMPLFASELSEIRYLSWNFICKLHAKIWSCILMKVRVTCWKCYIWCLLLCEIVRVNDYYFVLEQITCFFLYVSCN